VDAIQFQISAVTKNYKLVKLRQQCYQSTIVPLWLHSHYNMTFI